MEDERTPARPGSPDLLVGEIHRDRRDRRVLVIAAVVGIIAGAVLGLVTVLGAFDDDPAHATGFARHRRVIFVLGPPVLSMAIGYAIYAVRRRRRP